MIFIEPAFLWSALGIAIPIAIHFWHQKRGKPLPWAATRWLTERDQQQSRGLRLDNRWLLLLRCLLLVLLAILLAQPLLNWSDNEPTVQRIHLVQPSPVVADNFRFELDEARKKGEKIHWANESVGLVTDSNKPAEMIRPTAGTTGQFSPLTLQTAINKLQKRNTELHLYLVNSSSLADMPTITVPKAFRLHTVIDSVSQPRPFLLVSNNKRLFVNRAGLLTSSTTPDSPIQLQDKPVHSGTIRVGLDYRNSREKQTVQAALNALDNVYGLAFRIDDKPTADQPYDWVLTDRAPARPNPQMLYVVSGIGRPVAGNMVFTNETLTPQTSERVASGQLPEWLGEQLIRHYGLTTDVVPLSQRALNSLFVSSAKSDKMQQAGIQDALTLLFIVLLVLERGLALLKNA